MMCDLCHEKIEKKNEKYVHVEDFDRERVVKEIWVHLKCFKKAMNRGLTDVEKQAKSLLSKANRIFGSDTFNELFPEKQEIVIK